MAMRCVAVYRRGLDLFSLWPTPRYPGEISKVKSAGSHPAKPGEVAAHPKELNLPLPSHWKEKQTLGLLLRLLQMTMYLMWGCSAWPCSN